MSDLAAVTVENKVHNDESSYIPVAISKFNREQAYDILITAIDEWHRDVKDLPG